MLETTLSCVGLLVNVDFDVEFAPKKKLFIDHHINGFIKSLYDEKNKSAVLFT